MEIDYLWKPKENEGRTGLYVARVYDTKAKKEVRGSRRCCECLDSAIAASIKYIKNKHYK